MAVKTKARRYCCYVTTTNRAHLWNRLKAGSWCGRLKQERTIDKRGLSLPFVWLTTTEFMQRTKDKCCHECWLLVAKLRQRGN
jgi:hypothetical protein